MNQNKKNNLFLILEKFYNYSLYKNNILNKIYLFYIYQIFIK